MLSQAESDPLRRCCCTSPLSALPTILFAASFKRSRPQRRSACRDYWTPSEPSRPTLNRQVSFSPQRNACSRWPGVNLNLRLPRHSIRSREQSRTRPAELERRDLRAFPLLLSFRDLSGVLLDVLTTADSVKGCALILPAPFLGRLELALSFAGRNGFSEVERQ